VHERPVSMTLQKRTLTCSESSPVFCRAVMEGFMDVIMAVIVICSNIAVSTIMMQHHPACSFAICSDKCAGAQSIMPSLHNICIAWSVSDFRGSCMLLLPLHAFSLHTLARRASNQTCICRKFSMVTRWSSNQ